MFTAANASGRKILLTCFITGLVVAVIISCLQFTVSWHKREVKYDTLITDIKTYLVHYFADLKTSTDKLQPLTLSSCKAAPELTAKAAFSLNVRTFLLVRDKKHFARRQQAIWISPRPPCSGTGYF